MCSNGQGGHGGDDGGRDALAKTAHGVDVFTARDDERQPAAAREHLRFF